MTDAEIAANIREAVGKLNHFCHVAYHHGLFVQLTPATDPALRVTDVCVMRPILPPTPSTETASDA
jgi:hypothetical protein